jgi:PST family polysaccharide transporter
MPKNKNIFDIFYINDEFFIYPIIDKIKNKEEYKRLFSNFISLSVLQAANYLLPLITLPYLVRVLGPEKYGLVSFAQAFVTYFMILTDYGFNLSATREISINRDNKKKVSEIFSSVMTIKAGLLIVSFMLMSIIVFSFGKFSRDWPIYYLTFGMVLGQFLFPVWFFQGMERMKYITVLNITAKLIFTVAIFVFVHHMEDFLYVPLLNTLGYLVAGVLSFFIIKKNFNISFNYQNFKTIKYYLIDGWTIFLSRVYLSLYTTTNVFLLGIFCGNLSVGYYTIVEKIVLAIGGVFEPINQVIYPYLAKKYQENFQRFTNIIKKISITFIIISSLLFFIAQLLKKEIIYIVTGNNNRGITILLSIFLIRIIVYPFGSLFSNSLIIMKRKKEFMKGMHYTVSLNFLIVPLLIYTYGATGMVIGMVIIYVFIIIFYLIKLNQIIKEKKCKMNIYVH